FGDVADTAVGQVDGGVATMLPTLPTLQGVAATVRGDGVSIRFQPVDGAKDYRVYVLPANGDVSTAADGHTVVHNATYRCAGDRVAPVVHADAEQDQQSEESHTIVVGQVFGFARTMNDATLGYVFTEPGDGRMPVYAMGDPSDGSDTLYYFQRWN